MRKWKQLKEFGPKKIFLLVTLGFLVLTILFLLYYFMFNRDSSNVSNIPPREMMYEKYDFPGYRLNFYGRDFSISNNLELNENYDSTLYQISNFEEMVVNLRNAANALGLTKQLHNAYTNNYRWVRDSANDADYVYFDYLDGYFELNYTQGIDKKLSDDIDLLEFLKEFLGFKNLSLEIDSKSDAQKYKYAYVKLKFRDKTVYFENGTNIFLSVVLDTDYRIVNIFGYPFSIDAQPQTVLKPLKEISAGNIRDLYYKIHLNADDSAASSSINGQEVFIDFPVVIGFNRVKDMGYHLVKVNDNWLLVPVIVIESNYLDANRYRGKLDFIVINQSPQ